MNRGAGLSVGMSGSGNARPANAKIYLLRQVSHFNSKTISEEEKASYDCKPACNLSCHLENWPFRKGSLWSASISTLLFCVCLLATRLCFANILNEIWVSYRLMKILPLSKMSVF